MAREDHLNEVQSYCEGLAANLTKEISVLALGVWSKAPYKAMVVREGLLWRTEEFARAAHAAFDRGDRAVGILLSRSVIENTALLWRLRRILEERKAYSVQELHEILSRMLLGWKADEEFPPAFNVLTLIDHLDKEIPGVRSAYDSLSEVAHPNYCGVHGLYADVDRDAYVARFGRDLRGEEAEQAALSFLAASLGLFRVAYNAIGDLMPTWLSELAPLTGPRDSE